MQSQWVIRRQPLLGPTLGNQGFGKCRVFSIGQQPADHQAAEDVDDDIEVKEAPLDGALEFGDIPAPDLIGARSQEFRLLVAQVPSLRAPLADFAGWLEHTLEGV